ncbi:DUF2188 domain-containing protein [Cupriavidus basilensis]
MMQSKNVHIVPVGNAWAVELDGGTDRTVYPSQMAAIAAGWERAKRGQVDLLFLIGTAKSGLVTPLTMTCPTSSDRQSRVENRNSLHLSVTPRFRYAVRWQTGNRELFSSRETTPSVIEPAVADDYPELSRFCDRSMHCLAPIQPGPGGIRSGPRPSLQPELPSPALVGTGAERGSAPVSLA